MESTNRVLVVDDEPDIRDLIGLVLDATDLPHEEVGDGVEALERITHREYGSVILDLMMPGMDGFAVLKHLAEERPELLPKIIVLTGGSNDLVRRVNGRVFSVLRKPVVLRELLDTVSRCLDQSVCQ
jgi:CheY-like chemotaxis protein